jgi:RNA polymerase sigma factor (sigma-70 family)
MLVANIDSKYSYLAEIIELSVSNPKNKKLLVEANDARSKLIIAYMPLAKHLAKKYIGKLTKDEAESASLLGLCQAIRSWIPSKGNLATWIRLYCKNQLLKEIDYHTNLIKIPQAIAPKYNLIKYYKNQNLSDKEIIEKVNITMEEYQSINDIPTANNIENIEEHDNKYIDIDTYKETINDKYMLSDIESEILYHIYGYDKRVSYKELAEMYNTTPGRIKFVEAIALEKIKKVNQGSSYLNQVH